MSGQIHYRIRIAGRGMRRRDFLGLISGAAAAASSRSARAQQPNVVRLGYLKVTAPNGQLAHINVTQVTFIRSDTQISGANAELGMASGKVHGVQESVEEIVQQITAGRRGGVPWIKLTEPNGNLIHINVTQVTFIRADTQIPGANAELGMTSGKIHGVQEKVDDVMQLIAETE
jgi:uncharacterized protein YlzI (FlbEa/FlbD family)